MSAKDSQWSNVGAYYLALGCVCGSFCYLFGAGGGAGMSLAGIGLLAATRVLDKLIFWLTGRAAPGLGLGMDRWSAVWGIALLVLFAGGWVGRLASGSPWAAAASGALVGVTVVCGARFDRRERLLGAAASGVARTVVEHPETVWVSRAAPSENGCAPD